MKHNEEQLTREREEAWIGDAVLALFVREWILKEDEELDGDKFIRFTSNEFLRATGNPTRVEAGIGRIYRSEGLQGAFDFIRGNLLPIFLQQEKVRERRLRSGKQQRDRGTRTCLHDSGRTIRRTSRHPPHALRSRPLSGFNYQM